MKEYILPAVLVVGAVTVVGIRIAHRLPASDPVQKVAIAPAPEPVAAPLPTPAAPAEPEILLAPPEAAQPASPSPTPAPLLSAPAKPAKAPKVHLPDSPPVHAARAALASVGADPEAEAVWMDTINDPATPAEARNDLIEDLNQDGFDDPKHLTPDDLPLIESRIALVEQLGPSAMDDTNGAAFQEAYKDLLNMEAKLIGPAQ